MTAYVDSAAIVFKGKARHHLAATTVAELHAFAQAIGVARCWWHSGARHPHYDITDSQRDDALIAGAQPIAARELVRIALASRDDFTGVVA